MPFSVSISFSSHPLSPRSSSSMSPSPNPAKPRRNPAISSGAKRARPRGLWKARGSGPRASTYLDALPPSTPTEHPRQPVVPGSDSDSDRDLSSSSALSDQQLRGTVGLSPISTDFNDAMQVSAPVTKHQSQQHHLRQAHSSADPQQGDTSSDDSTHWTTRTKRMDISTTIGPGDPSSTGSTFTYEDWLDLKQLFANACEQYELDDPAETLPLLRGVIHECHRCLLAYHDPSDLFAPPKAPASPSGHKTHETTTHPTDILTAFHTLFGTTLFFFGNCIANNPELALPGEPSTPVPYWIVSLDVFESGENLPSRTDAFNNAMKFKLGTSPDNYTPPPREDWRMGVMWGRALVALANELVDRHRTNPRPPKPDYFPSPFPTNTDYMKTGTIWDDEPEWPPESPFGLITVRRPPITRRMILDRATPHEMLQIAMDHFSRGIFHMPHTTVTSTSSRYPFEPPFSRAKTLYEIGNEVLLLAEKLADPEERKEWAIYANSVFIQIHVSPHIHSESSPVTTSSPRSTSEPQSVISEGLVAKARGRVYLVIGSTMAEIIEGKMDEGSGDDEAMTSLIQSKDAEEARKALTRAIEFFERAKLFIAEDTQADNEEIEEEDNDDVMAIDEDDADDEQEADVLISARAREKRRRDSKAGEAQRTVTSRLEAKSISKKEAQKLRQQEIEEERAQVSHLLAEALCSLANLTESSEQQEEYYRRAENEAGTNLFDEDDEGMDEGH